MGVFELVGKWEKINHITLRRAKKQNEKCHITGGNQSRLNIYDCEM